LWFVNCKLKNSTCALEVVQAAFKFSKLDPGLCVRAVELNVLCVELSAACKLKELHLKLDVSLEQFVLGAHANCLTEKLPCGCELRLTDLEMGEHQPQLGEGETFVWYHAYALLIDLPRASDVFCDGFLIYGILQTGQS
jgi:hypothetical protein